METGTVPGRPVLEKMDTWISPTTTRESKVEQAPKKLHGRRYRACSWWSDTQKHLATRKNRGSIPKSGWFGTTSEGSNQQQHTGQTNQQVYSTRDRGEPGRWMNPQRETLQTCREHWSRIWRWKTILVCITGVIVNYGHLWKFYGLCIMDIWTLNITLDMIAVITRREALLAWNEDP